MKFKRSVSWKPMIIMLIIGSLLFVGCRPEKIVSCIRQHSDTSSCDETPAKDSSQANSATVSSTPDEKETGTATEGCSCEDMLATITALRGTVEALNATLSSNPNDTILTPSVMPETSTPLMTATVTPTPSITFTPTETYTPSPTYTPSTTPTITPSPTLDPGARFWEEFDDSQRWEIPEGVAFENGELEILGVDEIKLVSLPVEPLSEFYILVDAKLHDDTAMNTNIVFAFGEIQPGQSYNYITFNKDFVDVFQVVEGRSRFISSIQTPLEHFDTWQRIGISYRAEQLEVYLNGDLVMITQLASTGEQLALGGQFGESASDNAVYFDRLEVFPSRK